VVTATEVQLVLYGINNWDALIAYLGTRGYLTESPSKRQIAVASEAVELYNSFYNRCGAVQWRRRDRHIVQTREAFARGVATAKLYEDEGMLPPEFPGRLLTCTVDYEFKQSPNWIDIFVCNYMLFHSCERKLAGEHIT
jgi:hypothetical protein